MRKRLKNFFFNLKVTRTNKTSFWCVLGFVRVRRLKVITTSGGGLRVALVTCMLSGLFTKASTLHQLTAGFGSSEKGSPRVYIRAQKKNLQWNLHEHKWQFFLQIYIRGIFMSIQLGPFIFLSKRNISRLDVFVPNIWLKVSPSRFFRKLWKFSL